MCKSSKKSIILTSLLSFFVPSLLCASVPEFRFAEPSEAALLLATPDFFTQLLSPLDIALRRGTNKSISKESQYVFLSEQILEWNAQEIAATNLVIGQLKKALDLLSISANIPNEILLIKTSGDDEFQSDYTRSNAIIMPVGSNPRVIFHEFFHILSRYNPDLRDALYSIAGFQPVKNLIIPQNILDIMITNPDALELNHFIKVSNGNRLLKVVPLVLSKISKDQITGPVDLSLNLQIKLMQIEDTPNAHPVLDKNGTTVLIDVETTDYLQQIRANAGYVIHPEEIMADNFLLLVMQTLQSSNGRPLKYPEALDLLRKVLVLSENQF